MGITCGPCAKEGTDGVTRASPAPSDKDLTQDETGAEDPGADSPDASAPPASARGASLGGAAAPSTDTSPDAGVGEGDTNGADAGTGDGAATSRPESAPKVPELEIRFVK